MEDGNNKREDINNKRESSNNKEGGGKKEGRSKKISLPASVGCATKDLSGSSSKKVIKDHGID